MISHPDLDTRNTNKIRNIGYIVERVKNFIDECNTESKINHIISNNMIDLLKNNNFRMKTVETNTNVIKTLTSNKSGIGYGCATKWDVNSYLNNIVRIKTENFHTLHKILTISLTCPHSLSLRHSKPLAILHADQAILFFLLLLLLVLSFYPIQYFI